MRQLFRTGSSGATTRRWRHGFDLEHDDDGIVGLKSGRAVGRSHRGE